MFCNRVHSALPVMIAAAMSGAVIAVGCAAVNDDPGHGRLAPSDSAGSGAPGAGDPGGVSGTGGAPGGFDGLGGLPDRTSESSSSEPAVPVNPCGSECGDEELCDPDHLGLDDDCDGDVDETCSCIAGQAHACFRGDPSFRKSPGCFPGTEICAETGTWGPCTGGVHADEMCYAKVADCHPMQAMPFATVDLKDGTGSFSADAVPGTETWTVACPEGVDPCPTVGGMDPKDDFKPLQSGEYTVTYTKGLPGGQTAQCSYPLFVGARGLRVELEWEHEPESVDLDLYLHKPNNTEPWTIGGSEVACGYKNCTIDNLTPGWRSRPLTWFSDAATPPDPVNWYLDPVESNNSCFHAPRGVGAKWRATNKGCHSPRLDLDNISCDHRVTDPEASNFCAPENINVDFPPRDGWMRIGVHYYSGDVAFDVHPRVKIYCNGALGADLGPSGFYSPERPVAFAPGDSGDYAEDPDSKFWLVADVVFPDAGQCGNDACVVRPLYADEATKTPLIATKASISSSFGPPYPSMR